MKLSVIIPSFNSSMHIEKVLSSFNYSTIKPHEIIIVDDGSTDGSRNIIKNFNIHYIENSAHKNANYCRNLGAKKASGDVFVFMDSDVCITPSTLANIVKAFEDNKNAAVVGLYAVKKDYSTIFGKYKNLWIRYSYLKSGRSIDWVFGAITGIRKDIFFEMKGFDETLFTRQIDDLDLGKRITRAGYKILLDPDVEVTHLKEFTLKNLLKNEMNRSAGFVKIAGSISEIIKSVIKGFANVYPSFVISVLLSVCIVLNILIIPFFYPAIYAELFFIAAYIIINFPFLKYFASIYSFRSVPAIISIMFIDHFVCFFGSLKGLITILYRKAKLLFK